MSLSKTKKLGWFQTIDFNTGIYNLLNHCNI